MKYESWSIEGFKGFEQGGKNNGEKEYG